MSTQGLVMMLLVWGIVTAATGYCFFKVLAKGHPLSDGDDTPSGVDLGRSPKLEASDEPSDAIRPGPDPHVQE
jgi:hypothetical protein